MEGRVNNDRGAAIYDLILSLLEPLATGRWRRLLWRQVRGPRVLEIGIGTGLNLPYYRPELEVTAVDRGASMLRRARRRAAALGVTARLLEADGTALGDGVGCGFDAVVATFFFCSVDDPGRALMEIKRVLRPGGQILLLEHGRSRGRLGRVLDLAAGPVHRFCGDHIARDMEVALAGAGFLNVKAQPLLSDVVKLITAECGSALCQQGATTHDTK